MVSKRLEEMYPTGKEPRKRKTVEDLYIKYNGEDDIVWIRSSEGVYYDTYAGFVADLTSNGIVAPVFPASWEGLYWSNDPKEGHYYVVQGKRYPIPNSMIIQFVTIVTKVMTMKTKRDARDLAK